MRFIFLVFLFYASVVVADNRGVSDLGLCSKSYNCGRFLNRFDKTIISGWLDKTFNPSGCKCLEILKQSTKPKILRVHIINGSGLRFHRLQRFELGHGRTVSGLEKSILLGSKSFESTFKRRLLVVKKQLESLSNLEKCYISPCLECNFKKEARKKLLDITAEIIPECSLVDNPLLDSCLSGYVCEKHGDIKRLKPPYIVDMDGTDISKISPSWALEHKAADIAFGWSYCNNLNKSSGFIPPADRIAQCPTAIHRQLFNFIRGKYD